MAVVALFVVTPAFRLGFVMTTEWALALMVMGEGMAFVTIVIHAVWDTKTESLIWLKISGC